VIAERRHLLTGIARTGKLWGLLSSYKLKIIGQKPDINASFYKLVINWLDFSVTEVITCRYLWHIVIKY
jgi:hypothetical protein